MNSTALSSGRPREFQHFRVPRQACADVGPAVVTREHASIRESNSFGLLTGHLEGRKLVTVRLELPVPQLANRWQQGARLVQVFRPPDVQTQFRHQFGRMSRKPNEETCVGSCTVPRYIGHSGNGLVAVQSKSCRSLTTQFQRQKRI